MNPDDAGVLASFARHDRRLHECASMPQTMCGAGVKMSVARLLKYEYAATHREKHPEPKVYSHTQSQLIAK